MRDFGANIAFVAVREGTPVYDAHYNRIGVVEEVIADRHAGIFKGVVIHTIPLPGRHLVADVDQISGLHERGVLLSVDRQTLRPAPRDAAKVPRATREQALEHPIQATLRRLWDRITRSR